MLHFIFVIHRDSNGAGHFGYPPSPTPNGTGYYFPKWVWEGFEIFFLIPEPAPGFKKNLKPIPYPFRKIISRPIRGGARRVPEMTRPIAIPTCICLAPKNIKKREKNYLKK